jgi:hypothetical protein
MPTLPNGFSEGLATFGMGQRLKNNLGQMYSWNNVQPGGFLPGIRPPDYNKPVGPPPIGPSVPSVDYNVYPPKPPPPADCAPPMVPAPGGGCMPGPGQTSYSPYGGGNFGNLMNFAGMGPSGAGAAAGMPSLPAGFSEGLSTFGMGQRFRVKNL